MATLMQANLDIRDQTDVTIVGGGIMGASAAFRLSQHGKSVILLEPPARRSLNTTSRASPRQGHQHA